jgi:hypothetical protein
MDSGEDLESGKASSPRVLFPFLVVTFVFESEFFFFLFFFALSFFLLYSFVLSYSIYLFHSLCFLSL